jgi:D-alanyl-D-alanine carboxypeptidase
MLTQIKMKKVGILIILILGFWSCEKSFIEPTSTCVNDASIVVNENHPKGAKLQAKIEEYIAKGIPGMTILINDDNGFWINSGGFADIENGIEMQPCHINKLGSITKMMLGTLIWHLIQEGILNIDDKMSQYLPEVASRITNGDEITLGMLVNHTSGIYDIARDLDYNLAVINDMTKSWTEEEILNYIEDKPATNEPGADVNYSNTNTMLVGMIIEAATIYQHEELLKRVIFNPLGMDNTVYFDYATSFPKEHLAQGYLDFNNDGGDIQNLSNLNPGSGNGYTGVYSTVTDLYRFMNALLREKTLTTPENLELIMNSMRVNPEGQWRSSLGAIHDEQLELFINMPNVHAYGHAGSDIAYTANLNYFPHNNTIFAATYNYGTNLPSDLGTELRQLRKELYLIMAE